MRWENERESSNIEDRRGQSGGGGGLPFRTGAPQCAEIPGRNTRAAVSQEGAVDGRIEP